VVDDVVEVLTVAAAQIEEVPAGSPGERPAAIAKLGDRLVLLLDAVELLGDEPLRSAA
jgi:chemotaxis signal transduction protein